MKGLLNVAKLLQENSSDEAGAMTKYTELLEVYRHVLGHMEESDPKYNLLKEQMNQVVEFISDEQNHLKTLQEMYIALTKINPAED